MKVGAEGVSDWKVTKGDADYYSGIVFVKEQNASWEKKNRWISQFTEREKGILRPMEKEGTNEADGKCRLSPNGNMMLS